MTRVVVLAVCAAAASPAFATTLARDHDVELESFARAADVVVVGRVTSADPRGRVTYVAVERTLLGPLVDDTLVVAGASGAIENAPVLLFLARDGHAWSFMRGAPVVRVDRDVDVVVPELLPLADDGALRVAWRRERLAPQTLVGRIAALDDGPDVVAGLSPLPPQIPLAELGLGAACPPSDARDPQPCMRAAIASCTPSFSLAIAMPRWCGVVETERSYAAVVDRGGTCVVVVAEERRGGTVVKQCRALATDAKLPFVDALRDCSVVETLAANALR